jgi:hypothetical protein
VNGRAVADAVARLSPAQRTVLGLAAGSGAVDEAAVRAGTGWESGPVAVRLAELTGKRLLRLSGAWWELTARGVVVAAALSGVGGRTETGTGEGNREGVVSMDAGDGGGGGFSTTAVGVARVD